MKRFKLLYLAALLLPGQSAASASIFVVPDTVSISLDVVSVQADADLATQEVDAGIARIRALVDTLGDKDATTVIQDLRKEPRPHVRRGVAYYANVAILQLVNRMIF